MKTLKLFTAIAITAILGFTSCQSEENIQTGTNPNANSSTSPTASNYERAAMNDGSDDDFLDGNACTELLFPLTATVNGQEITLISKLDFSAVLDIMGEFNDDNDSVSFSFPINVKTSSYTEVKVNNQSELDALKQECESAEAQGKDAISCVDINFPITMLTYDITLEQTGSVVVQSEKQLYTFMTDLQSDELFAVNYPINATLSNGTEVQIKSDAEFTDSISECVQFEDEKDEAAETAVEVEAILSGAKFTVDSYIVAGVNTANDYVNYTIEFTNDLKLIAKDTVNTTTGEIEGTYAVSSETEVFLNTTFASNTAVSALGNDWVVSTYSNTLISLHSKTDASVTLTFKKI
ncbi:hypothetical protein H9W90_12605 [Polaribacter pectinis]|uniref:Lipocalin-like domain-containing protein n=1 Tax=Polaribacter pectinis TaxID=2738844 RepID=A0A7G9L8S5_9FLAO|nr:hypothetical protein [Polaribacter pectinis]QNM85024.1 hypothetical protein H9W90_12605 [Polaribacter pectinis]